MLPVWLVLAGLQLAQPHCESPGQARWGSRHGSDLPLRTFSVTRAISLSPLRALCFLHIARRLAAGGGGGAWTGRAPQYPQEMRIQSFCILYPCTSWRYFPRHVAPPLGQADRTPPPRWDAYLWLEFVLVLRLPTHVYTISHYQDPYPFPKPPMPMLAPSSPHPVHLTIHMPTPSHTAQHTSVASLLLLLYTQLPSSHICLSDVCLPLCNSSCSTLLQYGSGLYSLLNRSTSLSDRGPGVPESPHYLPLIPTASP